MSNESFTPEDGDVRKAQDLLFDQRSRLSAPWQVLNALVVLANGGPITAFTQSKQASENRLKWTVLAVAQGAIIHITANGPDEDERWTLNQPLDVQDLTANVYPRSILTHVSSAPEFGGRSLGTEGHPITPHYVAHLGPLGEVEVDIKTGAALIDLLRE